MAAEVAFSSSGDVSWRDDTALHIDLGSPTIATKGTYTIADTTTGLISRRAYHAHLGQRLANSIGQSLSAELKREMSAAATAAAGQ